MNEAHTCTECGLELPCAGAPEGLCPRCLVGAALEDDATDDEVLERLLGRTVDGKYRVERLLGTGGMGAVYLATHLGTERHVALKVLAPRLMDDEEFVERFRREARAAGRLRHPNIVNVTDFGFADLGDEGVLAYLVMEYLDGTSLAEYVAAGYERPLPWVADVVEQIALAVDEAHRHGVIHRDLKPANVWLVPDGRGGHLVKVLDFGLAKLGDIQEPSTSAAPNRPAGDESPTLALPQARPARRARGFGAWRSAVRVTGAGGALTVAGDPPSEAEGLTRVGSVLGTPLYMSPEQARGARLDGRSDVYSLGVVAFELLTGMRPFVGDTQTVVAHHADREPPRPSAFRAALPESIDGTVLSALAKAPSARPESATAFARSLKDTIATLLEDPGYLRNRSVAIYGEHLTAFLLTSAFSGLIPLAAGLALALTSYQNGTIGAAGALAVVLGGWLVGGLTNAAVVTPLVAHTIERPRERVLWGAIFRNLVRNCGRFSAAAFMSGWRPLGGLALILGLATLSWQLPNPVARIACMAFAVSIFGTLCHFISLGTVVAVLEPVPLRSIRARARQLDKRARDAQGAFVSRWWLGGTVVAAGVVLVVMLPSQAVGTEPGQIALVLALFALVASIVVNPVVAIRLALRYVQARRLGGEGLRELTASFAAPRGTGRPPYAAGDVPLRVVPQPIWPRVLLFSVIGAVPSVLSQLFGLYGGHISIVAIILSALIIAVAALFRARASSRLGITRDGIEVPGIDGRKVVRWCEVTKVRRDGREIVIHHSGRQKVLVNPSVYRNSDEIAEYVLARLRENGKVL